MKEIRIGQRVEAIDDNLEGIVTSIEGLDIEVETEDGFVVRFRESELIPSVSHTIRSSMFDVPSSVLVSKEDPSKKVTKRVKPKERNLPPMEVDLHIHQLTKRYKGMSNYEMLNLQMDTAKRQLDFAIAKRIPKVVFIHGVGEGVLREELLYLFRRYEQIKFYPADFQKYGQGATEVYIYQNSPKG